MNLIKPVKALGLMSDTSIDEAGLALILTDGVDVYEFLDHAKVPYDEELREKIVSVIGKKNDNEEDAEKIKETEEQLTSFHAEVIKDFISSYGNGIDVIGFEGSTICHNPKEFCTQQIGDAKKLAELTGIKVVSNFHKADVLAGGQGFPLTPAYYAALTNDLEKPTAIINLGGVSSVTWIGSHGEMLSFDAGPGNFAINNWVLKKAGMHMDYNGKLAVTGKIDDKILASLMKHKYLAVYPPKSLDKKTFNEKLEHLSGLSLEDGAATVTAFVAEAVAYSMLLYLPEVPKTVVICGGGAKNPTLVRFIKQRLADIDVKTASELGLDIDALDAGAIAFLAARRLNMLPISFPSTTGVPEPMVGGTIFEV